MNAAGAAKPWTQRAIPRKMRDQLEKGGNMSEVESRELSEQPTLVMRTEATAEEIPDLLGRAYHTTAAHAAIMGVEIVGP